MELHFFARNKYFLICLIPNIMVLFGYYENYIRRDSGTIPFRKMEVKRSRAVEMKYLVDTASCKIPDIDPLNSDVWPYYQKEEYLKCTTLGLLTYIDKSGDDVFLNINTSLLGSYSSSNITCCYTNVFRGSDDNTDNSISFSDCVPFEKGTRITSDLIKVTCSTPSEEEIYSNVHSIIQITPETEDTEPESDTSYSVLLIGIDTMSQLNFIRTMPKTYKLMQNDDWINLKGYNKIDDNTFPNLMAILTGMNLTQIHEICDPEHNVLDNCDMMWTRFRDSGYVTAYAEDEAHLNTFNYLMKGFDNSPTDFYYRSYFLAVETLTVIKKYLLSYCTGPETSGERILNLIKDFAKTFRNHVKFGVFWMNSFSHNNINTASSMDEVFVDFFTHLKEFQLLRNTIVIFFSDHGFRFGKIRYTYSGWLEERLPYNYIWIPESFQRRFPEKYQNIKFNSKRLTTPFDLYMTLQDILSMSDKNYNIQKSLACPKCRSLFQKVGDSRSCEDASISQHLCTCMGHFYIDPNSRIVKKAALFALDKLRSTVNSFKEGPTNCANYYLRSVISSGITETFYDSQNAAFQYLLIIFETIPKAVFEVTVSTSYQNSDSLFTLEGVISRIDRYGNTSNCISDPVLRKYCYCDGIYTKFQKTMNILFNS